MGGDVGCGSSGSGSVHVGFFLEFSNIFLVSDSLISKPVGNLRKQELMVKPEFNFNVS